MTIAPAPCFSVSCFRPQTSPRSAPEPSVATSTTDTGKPVPPEQSGASCFYIRRATALRPAKDKLPFSFGNIFLFFYFLFQCFRFASHLQGLLPILQSPFRIARHVVDVTAMLHYHIALRPIALHRIVDVNARLRVVAFLKKNPRIRIEESGIVRLCRSEER